MKNYLKVLSVPTWVYHSLDELDEASSDLCEISPVLNRDGYYYNRKTRKTWIEFNHKAWNYSTVEAFESELKHIDPEMETNVYQSLLSIVKKYRISFRNLESRFWTEYRTRELRDIRRNASLCCLGILRKSQ